jgi:DNA mismatch repair ATPase MutL
MNIDEIQVMWEADSNIDDNHLGEAATYTPKLHAKYVKLLIQTKLKLTKLNADYNTLRQDKFRYYRGEMGRDELTQRNWPQWQGTKPLKNEMDEFLSGDQDLNQIKMKIEYMEAMAYLLESIMSQIRSRDFQIKSGIDWKKFLAGM